MAPVAEPVNGSSFRAEDCKSNLEKVNPVRRGEFKQTQKGSIKSFSGTVARNLSNAW